MGKRTGGRPCDKPRGMRLSSLEKNTRTQTTNKETTIYSDSESNKSPTLEAGEPSPKRVNQKITPPTKTSTSASKAPTRRSFRQRHSTLGNTIEEPAAHIKPVKFNIDSPPDQINSPTKPSLKTLIQEMGFTDKTPEYQGSMNFLEAISSKNKVKPTEEIIDFILSDDSSNKMEFFYRRQAKQERSGHYHNQ